jgi:hypothetical protein
MEMRRDVRGDNLCVFSVLLAEICRFHANRKTRESTFAWGNESLGQLKKLFIPHAKKSNKQPPGGTKNRAISLSPIPYPQFTLTGEE